MHTKILECSHLSIGYSQPLVENINFILSPGKIVFIKGVNGSGKTTLIKTILGKVSPLKGQYKWYIKNDLVSYLPQITNPNSSFSFTIGEILDLYNIPQNKRDKIHSGLVNKKWIEASRGEKQKVMFLSRITNQMKVLILDEPFNHLDHSSILSLVEILIELINSGNNLSSIIVSHLNVDFPAEVLTEVELRL